MMYTYIKKNGRVGPDIMDVVTENPNMEYLGIMCSSIWDWDLEVDRVEVSDKVAESMGLFFNEDGECVRSFRWPKCPLPLPISVRIVRKKLPEGIFAIAWSNFPIDFPASCYLTDENHQCNRFYSAKKRKIDMTGKKCKKCKKGKYRETSIHDDMDGVLHCNNCGDEIKRWINEN